MSHLLNYIELAEALGLAPATVKRNWRIYNPIIVTENGLHKPTLKSARFTLERALAALEQLKNDHGGFYGRQKHKEAKGDHLSGHLLVSRQAAHQGLYNKSGGQNLGGRGKAPTDPPGKHAARFDVFRNVR